MDEIRKFRKELLQNCKDQKIELLLMMLLIIAAIWMCAGEFSEETVAANSAEAEQMMTESEEDAMILIVEEMTESDQPDESQAESESETETETETELSEEAALELMRHYDRRRMAALGSDFVIPMAMPEGYVRPEYGEKATETESENKQEQGKNDSDDDLTEYETETETVQMPNDSGTEKEKPQATNTTETTVLRHVYTITDWFKLPGYGLRLPKDLTDSEISDDSELENALIEKLASYDGDWSVYVKNLKTGSTITINDRPMKSASVMKLFILGTVYEAFENGDLQRTDEVVALMKDMIIYSSNDASNELLYRLGNSDYGRGITKVNAFIQEHGFSDMTVEYNGFDNPATVMGTGNYNQVSAKDCGKLLEDIYRREWVSRSVSNEIEQMMLNQNTRYKIPAGLPDGVACGNKSGEMDTTENDAAIIYADSCDYILVVLSSDWSSKDQAISRISEISAMVYQYMAE